MKINFLKLLGYWFLCLSVSVLFLNFQPVLAQEITYQKLKKTKFIVSRDEADKLRDSFAQTINESDVRILTPINQEFSLVIPAIALNQPVFKNIDPGNEQNFTPLLQKGVAHAWGSSLPGEGETIFLFGHSSVFSLDSGEREAVFYLLEKLEPGDQVNIFYHNQRYTYQVEAKEIINPEEVSILQSGGEEKLILQTCWPALTQLKRLVITAVPV